MVHKYTVLNHIFDTTTRYLLHSVHHRPVLSRSTKVIRSIHFLFFNLYTNNNNNNKNKNKNENKRRTLLFHYYQNINMCLLCFSTEPLRQDEINKGKYGNAYGQFISETDSKFQTTLCKAPCAAPGCWCTSMICCCCSQMIMRHKVLNNVNPGSGWSDYKCCQGFYGGCCCLQPGKCGEKACPVPCLCLEVCCCAGPAVSATSMVMRRQYHLGLDKDDVRLIRCNNCIFMVSCLLSCLTICIQSDTLDCAAHCANITSDIVFCCTSGCMLAQAYNECNYRDPNNITIAPSANEMER